MIVSERTRADLPELDDVQEQSQTESFKRSCPDCNERRMECILLQIESVDSDFHRMDACFSYSVEYPMSAPNDSDSWQVDLTRDVMMLKKLEQLK